MLCNSNQMRPVPSRNLPRGAVATLEAEDLEELSPLELKDIQTSVQNTCLLSCSKDFGDVCKKNSVIAASLKAEIYQQFCPKGKTCYCRTVSAQIYRNFALRPLLDDSVKNLRDLCSRKPICKEKARFVAYKDSYFTYEFLESLRIQLVNVFKTATSFFAKKKPVTGDKKQFIQEKSLKPQKVKKVKPTPKPKVKKPTKKTKTTKKNKKKLNL